MRTVFLDFLVAGVSTLGPLSSKCVVIFLSSRLSLKLHLAGGRGGTATEPSVMVVPLTGTFGRLAPVSSSSFNLLHASRPSLGLTTLLPLRLDCRALRMSAAKFECGLVTKLATCVRRTCSVRPQCLPACPCWLPISVALNHVRSLLPDGNEMHTHRAVHCQLSLPRFTDLPIPHRRIPTPLRPLSHLVKLNLEACSPHSTFGNILTCLGLVTPVYLLQPDTPTSLVRHS